MEVIQLTQLRAVTALLLTLAPGARGQGAATVPASSGAYDRIESVTAWFPLRGVSLGERALSRASMDRVVARLAALVDSARPSPRREWARAELASIRDALDDRHGVATGRRGLAGITWRGEFFSSHAPGVRVEPNGLGAIDAVSHAFAAGRHGWPAVQGTIASIAPTLVAGTPARLAAGVQPLSSLTTIRDGGWTSERLLHRAYVRGTWRNVAVRAGPDEMRWGQSPEGALFISGNAPPVPALTLGTDTAFVLPWLFRLAGPLRFTVMLGDLGGTQDPPNTRLAGWQATIQPWTRFELAVAVLAQTGGSGGPKGTFLERLVDLFPVIDALAPQPADLQISNKLAGGSLRLRFPELSGLDFYYELQIDDFDGRRLRSSLVEDSGHLLGLRLPTIVGGDQLVWRAEWQHTSIRLYEHAQFRSGTTYRQRLIGNPLGPHAAGGWLSATWRRSPLDAVGIVIGDERRDPAQYTVVTSGDRDRGWTFVRLTDDPDYRRRYVAATIEQTLPLGAAMLVVGRNQGWRTGQAGRTDWTARLTLSSSRITLF